MYNFDSATQGLHDSAKQQMNTLAQKITSIFSPALFADKSFCYKDIDMDWTVTFLSRWTLHQLDDSPTQEQSGAIYSIDADWLKYKSDSYWLSTMDSTMRYLSVFPSEAVLIGRACGLKDNEVYFSLMYPSEALQAYHAQKIAGALKTVIYVDDPNLNIDGAKPNAFLHAYWNAKMAYEFGSDLAEQVGTAHETYRYQDYLDSKLQDLADSGLTNLTIGENVVMDMYNNNTGRKIASAMPTTSNEIHAQLVLEFGSNAAVVQELEDTRKNKDLENISESDLLLMKLVLRGMENNELIWLHGNGE